MLKQLIEWIYLHIEGNLAYTDSLTDLKNRLYYDREVKRKYCTKEVYITYVDINDLKICNDTKGHAEGDELIRKVAKQLDQLDCLECCRIGGDEFIVISTNKINRTIEGASLGTIKLGLYEDVSSGVMKADKLCHRNKVSLKQQQ